MKGRENRQTAGSRLRFSSPRNRESPPFLHPPYPLSAKKISINDLLNSMDRLGKNGSSEAPSPFFRPQFSPSPRRKQLHDTPKYSRGGGSLCKSQIRICRLLLLSRMYVCPWLPQLKRNRPPPSRESLSRTSLRQKHASIASRAK